MQNQCRICPDCKDDHDGPCTPERWLRGQASGPMSLNPEHVETCNWLTRCADEIERLRARTHEIQEAADKRNAQLQSERDKLQNDRKWAHVQMAAYRQARNVACESEFDRLCVLDLRDEWQAEIDRLRAIVDRLPKTADGVPVVPGTCVYHTNGQWGIAPGIIGNGPIPLVGGGAYRIGECYSTREAGGGDDANN